MSRKDSSQKFIGRNRPPRVQINYDVELYGAEKTIELPFVTGVLADLSGANGAELPNIAERKFLEIDVDNFDERLASIKPTLRFAVDNQLTGEGKIGVELDIRSMDDFSPGALARNVEPLRQLLDARNQLNTLLTHMDGKSGAEQLLAQLLDNPSLMEALLTTAATSGADESTPGEQS